jgi:hypothetical protein
MTQKRFRKSPECPIEVVDEAATDGMLGNEDPFP